MKTLSGGGHLLPGIKSKAIEGVEVTVIADCCAGLTPESHEVALKVMECCQCNIR